MDQSKKHIKISGRVQGVGFRNFTRQNAQSLNLKGWVKNLSNGDVVAVIAGEKDNVLEMIEKLKEGPRMARVDDLSVDEESSALEESLDGFEVRH